MSSPSPDLQKSEHIYIASDPTDHQQCTCDNPKTEPLHHHCHPKSHHHVINLGHPPPTTTSHIHPIQAVHVHVHSSSPKAGTKMNNSLNNSCSCHGLAEDHGLNEISTGVEIEPHVLNNRNKIDADDRIEVSPLPPALPPRPPPRQRFDPAAINARYRARTNINSGGGIRKYVFWCCVCGGLATILGALFLAVYFLLRSYTSTLGYFETIPTFVPATMLILTGLCVISLARRKNRYSYLIKVCGLCCLVCALTCVLVTITTTVIHMNRLQTLRECVYTQKTRTCTCYSVLLEAHANADDGVRYVFDSTPDCEVIHGALYSCLRAMFGLSVSGILVCIFSCMLVYQLLSHEKKKMYWEQLELRCRSFYQQHSSGTSSTHGSVRGPPIPSSTYCSCCDECRYPTLQGPQVFPWDSHPPPERFWTPGRVGNFYSPNPGEEIATISDNQRNRNGWSWRRLPWSRASGPDTNPRDNSLSTTYQGVISSADSQYGFSNRDNFPSDPASGSTGSYSILDNRPPVGGVYVWGPPPPYSNPNSPARRPIHSPAHRYHHVHHHMHNHESHCQMSNNEPRNSRRNPRSKDNYENTTETEVHIEASETTDTSLERVSQTLPMRKMKKRNDMASVKSTNQSASNNSIRTNVQNVFKPLEDNPKEHDYQEPTVPESSKTNSETPPQCRFLPRLQGVENAAFQKQESPKDTTESEVYFADVSSCCNISVRNDGQDSLLYDETLDSQKPRLISLQKPAEKDKGFQDSNVSSSTVTEDEDYLPQRRQLSTRRMPFPLPTSEELAEFASSSDSRQLIPKDISQNSLNSVQTPMTETTDDGLTPVDECCNKFFPKDPSEQISSRPNNFNNPDQFLAPDAQYEVIQEDFSSNLTNTISGVNSYESYDQYEDANFSYSPKSKSAVPPKSLNLNQPTTRRHIGSNISALIQNLGGNPAGLLYEEVREDEMQGHTCNSDGTMDSGWQSGSEKDKKSEDSGEVSQQPQKSVNV